MEISTILRNMRHQGGFTQAEFAEKYHIPVRTLEDWESGSRKCPPYVTEFLYQIYAMDRIREGDVAVFFPRKDAEKWEKKIIADGYESLQDFCELQFEQLLEETLFTVVQWTVDIPWEKRDEISSLCSHNFPGSDPVVLGESDSQGEAFGLLAQYPPKAEKIEKENGEIVIRLTEAFVEEHTEDVDGESVDEGQFGTSWSFCWDDTDGLVIKNA